MIDIQILNNTHVQFYKKLWHDSEITLAKCFGFHIDVDNGLITASIASTSKRSMFYFLALAYKSFSESEAEAPRRNAFYQDLDNIYNYYTGYADSVLRSTLPYYSQMFQHQVESMQESYYRQFNFLAFEMGLGKTLTAASMSRMWKINTTLILCPAAVKFNWLADLKKFGFREYYFTVLDAKKKRTIRAIEERFVICNYDILDKFGPELLEREFGHFILDEAHNLKNHLSARSKNLAQLVKHYPQTPITFLSGTPVKNRVNDVFAYLKLTGNELGQNHKRFLDEYTVKAVGRGGERVTGGRNLQDLHVKLSNFMIRRTKEECLDLPDKAYFSYRFEMDDYRDEYNAVIAELSKQKHLSSLTSNLHSLNIITSKAKKKGIIELAESIIEDGRKVVIFGGYKEPLNDLEAYFGDRCVKIDGSVDSYTRNQHVEKFIGDPECVVFLGNMIAAGVGINLVNASDVIFMNFPFTPAELYQAIDRCHRIGQVKSVNIHYTFCDESIDEYIYDIIIDKEKDINALIDQGKETVLRENTIEILIKKLLNRDDIVFENFHKSDKDEVPGVEVQVETPEQINSVAPVQYGRDTHNTGAEGSPAEDVQRDAGCSTEGANQKIPVADAGVDKTLQGRTSNEILPEQSGSATTEQSNIENKAVGGPKYYLMYHEGSDVLFISNEERLKYHCDGGCDILFSHDDVNQVIMKGRHEQQTKPYPFDESYTPNEPFDLSKMAHVPVKVEIFDTKYTVTDDVIIGDTKIIVHAPVPEELRKALQGEDVVDVKTYTSTGLLTPPPGF